MSAFLPKKTSPARRLALLVAAASAFLGLIDSSSAMQTAVRRPTMESTEPTESETDNILEAVMREMNAIDILPDPQGDTVLRDALRNRIAGWHLASDPNLRALQIKRNSLMLQGSTFFYAAWSEKKGSIPPHESVVAPAADILDELLRTLWPELDPKIRDDFVQDFSDTRDEMVADPLSPGGKTQPDQDSWTAFRAKLSSVIIMVREDRQSFPSTSKVDDWRAMREMITLKAAAAREWHRMTAAMDVVELTPGIKAVMDNITLEVRQIEGRIKEAQELAFQKSLTTEGGPPEPIEELPSVGDVRSVSRESVELMTEDVDLTPDTIEEAIPESDVAPGSIDPGVGESPESGKHISVYACVAFVLAATGVTLFYRWRRR